MPLLHIVGVNNCNQTFSVAFCFLSAKKKDNYIWALEQFSIILNHHQPQVLVTDKEQALINAIDHVFPNSHHILCRWHIFKNIQLHCRKNFKSEEDWAEFRSLWNYLVASKSETQYEENFNKIYIKVNANTSHYLITNWLPLKYKFVSFWTDQFPHFNNCNTSRCGIYSSTK